MVVMRIFCGLKGQRRWELSILAPRGNEIFYHNCHALDSWLRNLLKPTTNQSLKPSGQEYLHPQTRNLFV